MSSTVGVNAINPQHSVVHKGSGGMSMALAPDVCKTPSPGGPVPVPYPNFARSATLSGGTTTVKADGQMIAVKGSEFSQSNGDEAGTAGGVPLRAASPRGASWSSVAPCSSSPGRT